MLAAVASLKVAAIVEWREEQVRNARYAAAYPTIGTVARGAADGSMKAHAIEILRGTATRFEYAVFGIAGVDGSPLAVWSRRPDGDKVVDSALVRQALERSSGVATRLLIGQGDAPYLDVAVAVEPGDPALGALFLRADAREVIASVVETWTEPSESAGADLVVPLGETIVVFRAPNQAYRANRAERVSTADQRRTEVKAILGSSGPVAGLDEEGQRAIAYSRPIPDSDWILQTHVAEAEVQRQLTQPERIVAGLVTSLVLAGAFLIILWWRQDANRFEMEERLRESETHFRTLADSGQALIWTAGIDKKCNYFNAPWLAFTGRTLEQELGDGWAEGVHPDDLERCFAIYVSAFDRRERFSMDYRLRTGDGEYRWIQDDGTPRFDSHGQFVGYIGHCLDISERKRHEAERDRLMTAIEQASEVIVLTDREGTIHYANPAFTAVTGYAVAEAVGRTPRILKSGEQDDAFYRQMWTSITDGKTWKGNLVNRRKDGTLYTEEATITPVRDSSGQITNFVAVKRDISEQMRMEAQLREAQKMESVGRLAGGVAHDFNNLLAVILSDASFVLDQMPEDSPLRGEVIEIQKAGERGAALTRQLLAFSRKQVLEPQILDLSQVTAGMEKMLRRLIGEDVDFALVLSPAIGLVKADPGQVEQVIMNLVVNAKDAMPDGGKLTVETSNVELREGDAALHPGANQGPYVRLAISDTGHGMDAATKERLFEPFFTTKGKGKGTGLGLSTVYGIIKQSGGHIMVSSEPNQGTTIEVYVPRHVGEPEPAETSRVTELPTTATETILLVEDEESVRRVTARMLRGAGYEVIVAANAREATLACENHASKIHLLVTDVVMPQVNGPQLAQQLVLQRPDLRVLFISGYPDGALGHHSTLGEGIAIIGKPFSAPDLIRKVRKTLDHN